MVNLNLGKYNKFVTALAGAGLVALTTFMPHVSWEPTLVAALSAFGVYQVPNDPGMPKPAVAV